jgi:hypothetical protein
MQVLLLALIDFSLSCIYWGAVCLFIPFYVSDIVGYVSDNSCTVVVQSRFNFEEFLKSIIQINECDTKTVEINHYHTCNSAKCMCASQNV